MINKLIESLFSNLNKRRKMILVIITFIIFITTIWTIWGNTALEINTFKITSEQIPSEFSGFRIAQVSDLHNTELGKDNKKLIQMLEESTPDIIAITGDLIDASDTDIEVALSFAEKAMQIAPCYYVTGNHEASASEYGQLRDGLLALGVVILENQNIEIERGSEVITVIGVNEPSFQPIEVTEDYSAMMNECLNPLVAENTNYKILLSHRPELFQVYVQNNIDLVLSGHAHGGQFRIPFIGGLVAPNQGILPTYDAGVYTKDQTNMVVSRGIGNSIIPIRFNNCPEIILIELLN